MATRVRAKLLEEMVLHVFVGVSWAVKRGGGGGTEWESLVGPFKDCRNSGSGWI